jgi:predicted DNA repair protein MutK
MSTGLIALLDDIAALAKVAAASLDDVAAQATKAGAKAAGVVIDDAAVTPRYVVGFAAARELPIVRRIALGSLKNKLVFLLPAALALGLFLPGAITPLLMLGGAFLCYEGAEKLWEKLVPHAAAPLAVAPGPQDPQALEDAKVRGAIQTDFILSAEIMAITLGTLPESSFWMQAVVLAVVGIGITVLVYGAVALIVKADDMGVALALHTAPASGNPAAPNRMDRMLRPFTQALGRGLVKGMPPFLVLLGGVGTAAMLWVGGGILLHGMETLGPSALPGFAHDVSHAAALAVPAMAGAVEWVVHALLAGVFGVLVGAALIPVVSWVIRPLVRLVRPAPRA